MHLVTTVEDVGGTHIERFLEVRIFSASKQQAHNVLTTAHTCTHTHTHTHTCKSMGVGDF